VTIAARAQALVLKPLADRCREADIAGSSYFLLLHCAMKNLKRSGHRQSVSTKAKTWADGIRPKHSPKRLKSL